MMEVKIKKEGYEIFKHYINNSCRNAGIFI